MRQRVKWHGPGMHIQRDAREIGVGPTLNIVPHRTFGFGRPTASDRPV